ncbi:MAG: hypothetical protein OXG18_07065 [Gemmatimonadetes bacterium]|nr:hypothetical protein [Gemmatimonadota bacterium]
MFRVMVGRLGGLLEGLWEGELEAVNERLRGTGGDTIVPDGVGVDGIVVDEGGVVRGPPVLSPTLSMLLPR